MDELWYWFDGVIIVIKKTLLHCTHLCRFEGNRLLSFKLLPSDAKAYAFKLCQAGFFYSSEEDEVIYALHVQDGLENGK